MKKTFMLFVLLIPAWAEAQPTSEWTPEKQAEFMRQMEQFQTDLNSQLEELQDSMEKLNDMYRQYNWSQEPEDGEKETRSYEEYTEIEPLGIEVWESDDSTEVRIGKWKVIVDENHDGDGDDVRIYKDEEYFDWHDNELKDVETKFLLLDIGLNNYFEKGFDSDFDSEYENFEPNPGKSWVVNLHAFNQRVNLVNYHLWLSYGIYFEFNSYKYDGNEVLVPGVDSVAFTTSDVDLKKSKLSCEYVGIPLMFRYETKPERLSESFHISLGGFGSYLMGAHTKTKDYAGNKDKARDDFNLNRFRYGLAARVGYSWVSIYTHIGLSKFLQSDVEPETYPFSAGLAFEF